jgi:hypothetical protein
MIAPFVTQSTGDKAFYGEEPMWSPDIFANSWQDLVTYAGERSSYLKTELQKIWP